MPHPISNEKPDGPALALRESSRIQSCVLGTECGALIAGIGARFAAIDVAAIPAVVRCRQVGEYGVDTVRSQVTAFSADIKVHAVTQQQVARSSAVPFPG